MSIGVPIGQDRAFLARKMRLMMPLFRGDRAICRHLDLAAAGHIDPHHPCWRQVAVIRPVSRV